MSGYAHVWLGRDGAGRYQVQCSVCGVGPATRSLPVARRRLREHRRWHGRWAR